MPCKRNYLGMRSEHRIIVGSRRSLLAMAQTQQLMRDLGLLFPRHKFVIKGIVTQGDRLKKWQDVQFKGVFVKEIEEMLLKGKIDLAIHSLKDLPVDIPRELEIAAVTRRVDPRDALISCKNLKLSTLKKTSCIGTSSLRRKAQLLLYRSDFRVKEIRGNLDTRLRKLKQGDYDAIIVAAAGMLRLGWEKYITEYIPETIMLPAPGQGAIGIEIRKGDNYIKSIVKKLDCQRSRIEVTAEREFLQSMSGGCRLPIAALGKIKGQRLELKGIVLEENGLSAVKSRLRGKKSSPKSIGRKLARQIIFLLKKQKRV